MDACLAHRRRLPRHRQLRAARRGEVRIQLAVGLPGPLQGGRPDGAARLGLRSRRHQRLRHVDQKAPARPIHTLDILDCNGGDHGQPFATNFNPEINIREVTAPARHCENGQWVETPALSTKQAFDFDQVGEKNMYLMYHEELESLAKHLPEIERDPLLDDLRRSVSQASRSAAERRHDPDRSGALRGPGDHPAAIPQSRAARAGQPRRDHQGQDQYRRHRDRHAKTASRRPSTSTTSATMRRPTGRPATRRSATPPACPR